MKVISIFGTRPEGIKMAPVVQALAETSGIESKVVVTGQHKEMLNQVLDLFNIVPDYDLKIMAKGQTLTDITVRVIEGLAPILKQEKPDLVLVHGDTTTTFSAALASFYEQIPVGHVEAGLRTHDLYSPFPEEANRRLTSVISALNFAPTLDAEANLIREGCKDKVVVTGNTVIDALLRVVKLPYDLTQVEGLDASDLEKKIILLTAHRRENLGKNMRAIFSAVRDVLRDVPDSLVVFPIHKNPKVREMAFEILGDSESVRFIEPLDYHPFVKLMEVATLILTDSGGIQEEAPSLGKPVLVLRETTERPEAVSAGTVALVGVKYEAIYQKALELLTNEEAYNHMAMLKNPYGDGQASERIVDGIKKWRERK